MYFDKNKQIIPCVTNKSFVFIITYKGNISCIDMDYLVLVDVAKQRYWNAFWDNFIIIAGICLYLAIDQELLDTEYLEV